MPSDRSKIIEQAKFTYFLLAKEFEKQTKTIEGQRTKQIEALKVLKPGENQELESIEGLLPKKIRNNKSKNKTDEIKN